MIYTFKSHSNHMEQIFFLVYMDSTLQCLRKKMDRSMHNLHIRNSTNFHFIIEEISFAMNCRQTPYQIFYEVINKLIKRAQKHKNPTSTNIEKLGPHRFLEPQKHKTTCNTTIDLKSIIIT